MGSIARRSFKSAAVRITNMPETKSYIVTEVARSIKREMKSICSFAHNSMLRDQKQDLRLFSWEKLFVEFKQNVPTLVHFLSCLLPKADEKLVSFICGVILKKRCKHMSLMQRVISVMLYGNASHKEVHS